MPILAVYMQNSDLDIYWQCSNVHDQMFLDAIMVTRRELWVSCDLKKKIKFPNFGHLPIRTHMPALPITRQQTTGKGEG